jgi:DNA polymerase
MDIDVIEDREALAELLAWHISAGAEAVLDDMPHNRFEEALVDAGLSREVPKRAGLRSDRAEPPSRGVSAPVAAIVTGPIRDWVQEAESLAQAATSLEELLEKISGFEGCPLSRTSKSCILARKPAENGILVIGDSPEADDDRSGEAFSGRAGVLLEVMMRSIGVERSGLAITSAIPWRPPGNRAPTIPELEVCAPFLRRQIELVQPRWLLALGNLPAHLLAARHESLLKLRGQWTELVINGKPLRMMTTLPPSYLLRQPMQKRFAWRDLKAFRAAMKD